jgi:hypothetical protein
MQNPFQRNFRDSWHMPVEIDCCIRTHHSCRVIPCNGRIQPDASCPVLPKRLVNSLAKTYCRVDGTALCLPLFRPSEGQTRNKWDSKSTLSGTYRKRDPLGDDQEQQNALPDSTVIIPDSHIHCIVFYQNYLYQDHIKPYTRHYLHFTQNSEIPIIGIGRG